MSGLTSKQKWTHDHLARCTCCGSWEIVTDAEMKMRAASLMPDQTSCTHLDPFLAQQESA